MGAPLDGAEGAVQDLLIQEEQVVDPVLTSGVVQVEDEEDPAGSGIPLAEGE